MSFLNFKIVPEYRDGKLGTGLNHLTLFADGAGDYYVAADTFWKIGAINAGVTFQCSAGFTISYTLAPKDQVLSADAPTAAGVPWSTGVVVTSGVMHNAFPICFTVAKITLAGPAQMYVGSY